MSTADLLQELDSTLELAYTVKETLNQVEPRKMALTLVGIGADTDERNNSLLQDMLRQVLHIAQRVCKFLEGRPDSRFRLRTRCTNRKLDGLSKLGKETGETLNDPDAVLEYMQTALNNKQSQPQDLQ